MDVIESFYRLFIIVVSYQCCLGEPSSNYEIPLPSIHVRGDNRTFTNVVLRKFSSPAVGCLFDVIFPQSRDVTNGPFTPAEAEITFLYEKRMVLGVYKESNSTTMYGLNFDTEASLQLFFVSLRHYQPGPQSFSFAVGILRYSRSRPNNMHVMVQLCEFHVHAFEKPGITWKSFNFTKVTNTSTGTREGILTFVPETFSVSQPLGRTKFSLCHHGAAISDEVFIVIFTNVSSAKRFTDEVHHEQHPDRLNSCEFPNLDEAKKQKIAAIKKRGREQIEPSDFE